MNWRTLRSFCYAFVAMLIAAAGSTAGASPTLGPAGGASISDEIAQLKTGKTSSLRQSTAETYWLFGGGGPDDADVVRSHAVKAHFGVATICRPAAFDVRKPIAQVRDGLSRAPPSA